MIDPTYIGLAAGILTTLAFLPQVIRVWNTKSTHNISFPAFTILLCGSLLWDFYGLQIDSLPIIFANSLTAVLVFMILILKLKYK